MSEPVLRQSAAILAVGDELLNGQQLDTNSSWLAARLLDRGWTVESVSLLGDDEAAIERELDTLCARVELVVVTGGLGPTLDDVTRHGIARAVRRELRLDGNVVREIRELFESAGREMASSNERQALFPEGAVVMANRWGTAPGFRIQHPAGAWIASFPGPPRELHGMFVEEFEPWLRESLAGAVVPRVARFNLFGIPESDFAQQVGEWMARDATPRIGVCASGRVLKVRIDGRGAAGELADTRFAERVVAFRERFYAAIFSEGEETTAEALGRELRARGCSFASAESCTGGEIASRLIAQPGISEVFLEGFVTYSNGAKEARLGVARETLDAFGAVSPEVAAAMAQGAARESGARLALSTTGIAGPDGGTPEKPVGLVYVGVALDGVVTTHELRFPPRGRDLIRDWATTSACELARRALVETSGSGTPTGSHGI